LESSVPADLFGLVGVFRGHEAVRGWFREWFGAWERVDFGHERLIDAGDHVVDFVRANVRGRESGVEFEFPSYAVVWTLRDGKIVRMKIYWDLQEAIKAVGLSLEAAGLRESAMPEENVDLVRAVIDHYNASGDFPWQKIDPEIEWVIDPPAFVAGTYRGKEGIRRLLGLLAEAFDRWELEVDNYIDAGESVVALGRSKFHGGRSGVTAGQPLGYTFLVRGGRLAAARAYVERPEDALEAVGLRE
jgi:ketosteroid isomerase-like protein